MKKKYFYINTVPTPNYKICELYLLYTSKQSIYPSHSVTEITIKQTSETRIYAKVI